ncbi:hypothetical protein [Streptomyces sp. bgisy060]|uniref:hypothetical protein n=1 Tax=Streptomyces sp. bgisy060 TaxID=3413775 RepID=UPI003EBAD91A
MSGRTEREHGYARYKLDGCRCYTCGFANAAYYEARERAIMYGTWQPFTAAAPVREHLLRLRSCDMGLRRVAAVAGVDRQRLQAVLTGRPERGTPPQAKVRPALAAAVLAVEPTLDNLGGSTVIAAVGTHRRLQALVARGWPQAQLARRLGWTEANFSALLRQDHVIVRTALAVRALYEQLWDQDPRQHGVDNQAYSRATNHALARNWAPPAAWDDDTIDDPDAHFDLGAQVPRHLALAKNAEWLVEQHGYSRRHAADRLGVSKNTLDQSISRARRDQAVTS